MIRPIMKMQFFLQKPSDPATAEDLPIAQDLIDTLEAHRRTCVGMAANMIGQRKRIIAVVDKSGEIIVMLNPVVINGSDTYRAEEKCLSLEGVRPAMRYRHIHVAWEDVQLQPREATFSDFVAQAIQHEIDHCNGIVI